LGTVRARTDEAFRELILRMVGFYRDNLFNPHWGEQLAFGPHNTLHISMVCQGLDSSSVEGTWRPLFDHFKSNPDLSVTGTLWAGTVPARHWWDAVWHKSRDGSMIDDPRPGAPATRAWWSGDQAQAGDCRGDAGIESGCACSGVVRIGEQFLRGGVAAVVLGGSLCAAAGGEGEV